MPFSLVLRAMSDAGDAGVPPVSSEVFEEWNEAGSRFLKAADVLDAYLPRIVANHSQALADFLAVTSSILPAIDATRSNLIRNARGQQRRQSQWLAKRFDECAAVESALLAGASLAVWTGPSLDVLFDSMCSILPLEDACGLPCHSSMLSLPPLGFTDTVAALSASTAVFNDAFHLASGVLSGPPHLMRGVEAAAFNSFSMPSPSRFLLVSDVEVSVTGCDSLPGSFGSPAGAVALRACALVDGPISFSVELMDGLTARRVTVVVSAFGRELARLSLPVGASLRAHSHSQIICICNGLYQIVSAEAPCRDSCLNVVSRVH